MSNLYSFHIGFLYEMTDENGFVDGAQRSVVMSLLSESRTTDHDNDDTLICHHRLLGRHPSGQTMRSSQRRETQTQDASHLDHERHVDVPQHVHVIDNIVGSLVSVGKVVCEDVVLERLRKS